MSAVARRLAGLLVLLASLLGLPALAQAAVAPSLTVDAPFAPPTGVATADLAVLPSGTIVTPDEGPHGIAVAGDRIYTVGKAYGSTANGQDLAVLARHADGTLDTSFSGDGKLLVAVGPGTVDEGFAVAVLPDGSLRIAGRAGNNAVVIGVTAAGTPDARFGTPNAIGTAQVVTIPSGAASGSSTASAQGIAVGPDGRLAVVGNDGANAFVALLDSVSGAALAAPLTLAGASGVDVAFRPGGSLAALLQDNAGTTAAAAVLYGVTADGTATDTSFGTGGQVLLAPGGTPTTAAALIGYAGRLYATGTTQIGGASAYLARTDANGGGAAYRTFVMRGAIRSDLAITSTGTDLGIVGGSTPALVVSGYTDTGSSGAYWAAAAFDGFDGALDQAPMGSVVVPTDETPDTAPHLAAGDGFAAIGGSLTSGNDTSWGTAKLLLDADKACDLAVSVPTPLEIRFHGRAAAAMTVRVTNAGTKACGGTVSVPAPYVMSRGGVRGPIATGTIQPGESSDSDVELRRSGNPVPEDVLPVSVTAPGDAVGSNDMAAVHVTSLYCDLQLRAARFASLPDQGTRRVAVTVRNRGTTPCRRVVVRAAGQGRVTSAIHPYTLAAGRSTAYEVAVAHHGGHVGRALKLVLRADTTSADAVASNSHVTRRPTLVRVGDSDIGHVSRIAIAGRARDGHGARPSRELRVRDVEVAVRRLGTGGCRWLTGAGGRWTTLPAGRRGACRSVRWIRATGTTHWRLTLRRALPAGTYEIRSRAIIRAGLREARFGTADRNLRRVRLG